MLSCKEAAKLIAQSLDRKLSWRQRLSVHLHVLLCGPCSYFRRQMLFLRDAIRRSPESIEQDDPSGPVLSEEARERIKDTLRSQQ